MFFRVKPILRRWKQQINTQLESIIYHSRYNSLQSSRGSLQTRISVDFYQPRLKVLINHKIKPKYFKCRQAIPITKQMRSSQDRISCYFFELRRYILNKFKISLLTMVIVQIFLEIMITELVAVFIFAILIAIDLNGIICQVYKLIIRILYLIFIATCSDIALAVPITLSLAILNNLYHTSRTSSM